jgi:hypothetical protein
VLNSLSPGLALVGVFFRLIFELIAGQYSWTSGATGLIPSRYRRETDFMMTKEWVELCRKSEKLTNDKRRLTVTNRVRAS